MRSESKMADPSLLIAITGLIVSIGGVIGALMSSRVSARKNELDAVTSRLQSSIDHVTAENDRLRRRLDEVEQDNIRLHSQIAAYEIERLSNLRRIALLEQQVASLEQQLTDLDITPVTKKEG